MKRTDLACEFATDSTTKGGINISRRNLNGVGIVAADIDASAEKATGRAKGRYITIECAGIQKKSLIDALSSILAEMIPDGSVLVAGLGNENITPDSLGTRTVSHIAATAHFSHTDEFAQLGLRSVYAFRTGVMAQTGIESAQQLKCLCDGSRPQMLIVIDSLACSEKERLARTIQITNTGISPGSGVDNARKELSMRTVGVPVVAIGVPTVIDLESLVESGKGMMVTPRDIDSSIGFFSSVISSALNSALNPNLSESEINSLLC